MTVQLPIILIGGAPLVGKSTLAASLSRRLGIPWVSTDDIRKWMQQLVRKEEYPDLFYGDGLDIVTFYERYATAHQMLEMENRQGVDVQKGIAAMIDSFWWWNEFIIEGIAITPVFVRHLQRLHPQMGITPVFLVDRDSDSIKKRLDTRGLWDAAGTYPEHIKPKELAWVTLFNEYYEREAPRYGFTLHDITELQELERMFGTRASHKATNG